MAQIVIDYVPTPKQALFHATDADEVLYGGAAGGGKSCAIVMDALSRCLKHAGTNAYIFRRTYPELENTVIKEAKERYPIEIAKYNNTHHVMRLFNGSHVFFRHCAAISDMYSYQGAEIDWLYFDELTHFEQPIYEYLKTRKRSKELRHITPTVRSSSNPGGTGHSWVKAMFVDAAPYMQKVEQSVYSKILNETRIITTQYIPSLAIENPHITKDYIFELEQKPEALRKALLEGNWDAFEGQVFTEWRDDPAHYIDRKWTHVIEPFDVPLTWPRFMSFDHGYSKPFAVCWWAMDREGRLYQYREWYGCTSRPNDGIKITPRQIAEGILAREESERTENLHITRIADPAIFDESRGFSVAVQMEPSMGCKGIYLEKGDNTRLAGKMQVHERLRFGDDGRPMVYVFNTCKETIRTLPALPYDPTKPEDIDTDAEDHLFDSWRYCFMANPLPVIGRRPKPVKVFDPFTQGGFK